MKIKKSLSLILSMIMLVSSVLCVNINALAEGVSFDYNESSGTLTFSGEGEIDSFNENTLMLRQWNDYCQDATSVVIEDGITKIGDYAFCRMQNLTSVTISDSVTEIGRAAFASCDALLEITVPDTVTTIGDSALGFMSDLSISSDFVVNCGIKSAAQKYCLKNYVPFNTPIINDEATGIVTFGGEQLLWSFVAPSNGVITFYSLGMKDTYGCLYDAEDYVYYEKISDFKKKSSKVRNDDGGTNANFKLSYQVEAGHRYYLGANFILSNVYAGSDEWENGIINVVTSFTPDEEEQPPHVTHNFIPTVDGNVTIFNCDGCEESYVVDKTALVSAVETANTLKNENDYEAKYTATSKQNFENALVEAMNAQNQLIETQDEVDALTSALGEAQNNLEKQTKTITVRIVDADSSDVIDTQTISAKYGESFNYSYVIPNGEGDYEKFPAYIFYKWTKGDKLLNAKDTSIESVATENATYYLYLLPFQASQETDQVVQTRVRFLDKSNRTIYVDYVDLGSSISANDYSVTAPDVAFYDFSYWECVYGNPENVTEREVVFKAVYELNDSLSNKCNIISLCDDVKVNGKASDSVGYDKLVTLTGAKEYAYCDKDGNIISAINGTTIYAPHSQTVYITKLETELSAATLVTGSFITDNGAYKTLTVNAQYYVPNQKSADECGIVVSKTNSNPEIEFAGCAKVVSTIQGDNHEYSIAMNYSVPGTLYVRSYVIVDGTPIYSAVKTITLE